MKTTQKNNRRRLLLSMCLAAAVIAPATASARTQPASSGRAVAAGDFGCFGMWYSAMINRCGTTRNFEIPLIIDNRGYKTVQITAYGENPANNVCCSSTGVNREVTAVWGSGHPRCLPRFGVAQVITTTGAYVPTNGYAYATCRVSPGGRVHTVNFNP